MSSAVVIPYFWEMPKTVSFFFTLYMSRHLFTWALTEPIVKVVRMAISHKIFFIFFNKAIKKAKIFV